MSIILAPDLPKLHVSHYSLLMGTFRWVGWSERSRWFGSVLISLHTFYPFYWLPGPKIMIVWSLYTYTDTDLCFTFKFNTFLLGFKRWLPGIAFIFSSATSGAISVNFWVTFYNQLYSSWFLEVSAFRDFSSSGVLFIYIIVMPWQLNNTGFAGCFQNRNSGHPHDSVFYNYFFLVRHIKNRLVKKLCTYIHSMSFLEWHKL